MFSLLLDLLKRTEMSTSSTPARSAAPGKWRLLATVSPTFAQSSTLTFQALRPEQHSKTGARMVPGADQILQGKRSLSLLASIDCGSRTWFQESLTMFQNVKITNFSSSWADGLAFCALIHSFLPDAFDYDQLNSTNRRHNFELAFETAR